MATVQKIWTFASTAENFTLLSEDGGGTGTVTYDAGFTALKFTYTHTATAEDVNFISRLSAAESWETWGVPAGGVVTSVELADLSIATETNGDRGLDSATLLVDILNSAGTVNVANILPSYLLPTIDGSTYQYDTFYGTGAQGAQSIGSSYQASNTNLLVKFEMLYSINGSVATNLSNLFINLTLDINYTPPASNTKYYLIT